MTITSRASPNCARGGSGRHGPCGRAGRFSRSRATPVMSCGAASLRSSRSPYRPRRRAVRVPSGRGGEVGELDLPAHGRGHSSRASSRLPSTWAHRPPRAVIGGGCRFAMRSMRSCLCCAAACSDWPCSPASTTTWTGGEFVPDMRATERLLEVIGEQCSIATHWTTDPAAKDALKQIDAPSRSCAVAGTLSCDVRIRGCSSRRARMPWLCRIARRSNRRSSGSRTLGAG